MAKNKTTDTKDKQGFKDRMERLSGMLLEQQAEAVKLDAAIAANLKELGYGE